MVQQHKGDGCQGIGEGSIMEGVRVAGGLYGNIIEAPVAVLRQLKPMGEEGSWRLQHSHRGWRMQGVKIIRERGQVSGEDKNSTVRKRGWRCREAVPSVGGGSHFK